MGTRWPLLCPPRINRHNRCFMKSGTFLSVALGGEWLNHDAMHQTTCFEHAICLLDTTLCELYSCMISLYGQIRTEPKHTCKTTGSRRFSAIPVNKLQPPREHPVAEQCATRQLMSSTSSQNLLVETEPDIDDKVNMRNLCAVCGMLCITIRNFHRRWLIRLRNLARYTCLLICL